MKKEKEPTTTVRVFLKHYAQAEKLAMDTPLNVRETINIALSMGLAQIEKSGYVFSQKPAEPKKVTEAEELIMASEAMTDEGKLKWLEWYSSLTTKQQYILRFLYSSHMAMARKKEFMQVSDKTDKHGDIQDLPPEYEERYKKGFPLEDKKI